MIELPPRYNPEEVEGALYERWEKSGAFAPPVKEDGETTFSILMPPTNANGSLHVGHAVGGTLQDLMIRYHRMRGDATVWLPGLDHAGFETQVVFEKVLEKEGTSRFELDRDDFYQRTMDFTRKNSSTIVEQFKKLGSSADWDHLKFTLDEDVVSHVYQTFKQLHDDGLAYRATRPIHWCPKHQTALSDLEVIDEVQTDKLYVLQYGPLTVATVRPETIFGDAAVAVHPNDPRYKDLVGTDIEVDFGIEKRMIPVVADEYVDPAFGTGAVKITPLHDPNDFEVAERHNLPMARLAIDERARMTDVAGPFAGMKVEEAREAVLKLLEEKGLLVSTKDYEHSVKRCYKCKRMIEPRVLNQWFIAVSKQGKSGKALAPDAAKAVADGQTTFVTERFRKIFDHWMGNIRDWNVSRQIVWGIQLPVWYCTDHADCAPTVTAGETPTECGTCHGTNITRDTDVFDTWFSSCQWPFIVPQTTGRTDDIERFYPTSVMETAHDILFFWVARMIMLGLYVTDDVPFKHVYLHGLVRDKDRQKMSKSKGNVIDPLAVIGDYGADALRMALVFGTAAGNDMPIGEEKIRGMRNFTTKVWNIARFILANLEGTPSTGFAAKTDADREILKQLDGTTATVTKNIDSFQFHEAAQTVYAFIWDTFASVYLEAAKIQLGNASSRAGREISSNREQDFSSSPRNDTDKAIVDNTRAILVHVLKQSVTLLHPFMPFVTESIWEKLPKADSDSELLITQAWPK